LSRQFVWAAYRFDDNSKLLVVTTLASIVQIQADQIIGQGQIGLMQNFLSHGAAGLSLNGEVSAKPR
jgi:hypothetical protein